MICMIYVRTPRRRTPRFIPWRDGLKWCLLSVAVVLVGVKPARTADTADGPINAAAEWTRAGWTRLAADATVVGAARLTALAPFPRLVDALGRRFLPGHDAQRLVDAVREQVVFGWTPARADSFRAAFRLTEPLTAREFGARFATRFAGGDPTTDAPASVAVVGGHRWTFGPDQAAALLDGGTLVLVARPAELTRALAEPAVRAPAFPATLFPADGGLARTEPFWVSARLAGDAWIRSAFGAAAFTPVSPGGGGAEPSLLHVRAEVEAVDPAQAAAMEQLAGLLPLLSGIPPERVRVEGDGVRRALDARATEAELLRLLGAGDDDRLPRGPDEP